MKRVVSKGREYFYDRVKPVDPRLIENLHHYAPHLCWAARSRSAGSTLKPEDVHQMLRDQGYCCAVSGIQFVLGSGGEAGSRNPWRPSIDRVDTSRGYTPENCRLVCVVVNFARNDWGDDVLIRMAQAIAGRNGYRKSGKPGRPKRKTDLQPIENAA